MMQNDHLMSQRGRKPKVAKASDLEAKYCNTCGRNLLSIPYAKCTKCGDFTQCLACMSIGNNCDAHVLSHTMMIINPDTQYVYQEGWTQEQEALLLIAIQICGIENWHEIEKIVGTKTAEECEYHYFQTYIDSPTAPLPQPTILPSLELPPPLPYDTTPRDSRPSISNEYNLHQRGKSTSTTPAEFAGWMPYRHEFEIEYINEAEDLISGLVVGPNDTQETLDFKIKQLVAYNNHLDTRDKRREFALEYNMLDHEVRDLGGRTPEEVSIERQLMPLAQVLPRKELYALAQAIEDETRAKNDMKVLTEWRRSGIATHDEGFIYNRLQELLHKKLTEAEVEEWNTCITRYMNSTEFRATLDRVIMSKVENELTQQLSIAPNLYLTIKGRLLTEFTARGKMTREIAMEMVPDMAEVVVPIYELMNRRGLFLRMDDIINQTDALKQAKSAAEAESNRLKGKTQ